MTSENYSGHFEERPPEPVGLTLTGRPFLWSVGAGVALLSVYFLILTIANSADHVLEEFYAVWYWIVPLTIGFGIQAGLFSYIRIAKKALSHGAATSSVAVSGGVSTTSMVACCAHHLTDILPFMGATAAAVFLTRFQSTFMVVGIFSNLIGILMMLSIIKKGSLFHEGQRLLPRVAGIDFKKAILIVGLLGVIATGASIYSSL